MPQYRQSEDRRASAIPRAWLAACAVLATLSQPAAAPPEPTPPTCSELGPIRTVSHYGRETKLFAELQERIAALRGATPSTESVASRFRACLDTWRETEEEGAPALLPKLHFEIGDSKQLHFGFEGQEIQRLALSLPLSRLVARVQRGLLRATEQGPERDALERALWYLWFEATVRAGGERHDYYSYADAIASVRARDRGRSFGIGIDCEKVSDELRVRAIEDPALRTAGLAVGDRVTNVNGRAPLSMSAHELGALWLATEPFPYTLEALRDGETTTYRAHARPRLHTTLRATRSDDVLYLKLTSFSKRSERELRRILRAERRRGPFRIVLDLRGNPGGTISLGLVDLFLHPGQTVASIEDRGDSEPSDIIATIEYFDEKLVVLVDRDSASMSEIFAAAMRAHERAELVGEPTRGKAVGQRVFPVGDEGQIALVDFRCFFPGTRESWDTVGIAPEWSVTVSDELREELDEAYAAPVLDLARLAERDPALRRALATLEEAP